MKRFMILFALMSCLIFSSSAFADGSAVFVGDNQILITGAVVDDDDYDVFTALGLVPGSSTLVIDKIMWYGSAIVIGDICELEIDDTHPISPILNSTVAGQPLASPKINLKVNKLYVDRLDHGSCCIIYRFSK